MAAQSRKKWLITPEKASRPDPLDSRGFRRKRFSELEECGGIFDTRKRLRVFLLCLTSWLFSSLKIVWAKAWHGSWLHLNNNASCSFHHCSAIFFCSCKDVRRMEIKLHIFRVASWGILYEQQKSGLPYGFINFEVGHYGHIRHW